MRMRSIPIPIDDCDVTEGERDEKNTIKWMNWQEKGWTDKRNDDNKNKNFSDKRNRMEWREHIWLQLNESDECFNKIETNNNSNNNDGKFKFISAGRPTDRLAGK